jgi:hypothetical protein
MLTFLNKNRIKTMSLSEFQFIFLQSLFNQVSVESLQLPFYFVLYHLSTLSTTSFSAPHPLFAPFYFLSRDLAHDWVVLLLSKLFLRTWYYEQMPEGKNQSLLSLNVLQTHPIVVVF